MKKILIYIMLIALVVSGLAFPVSAEQTYTDDDKYLYFARYFSLIDSDADNEDIVTKAYFAKCISLMAGYTENEAENPLKYQHTEGSIAQYDYKKIQGQPIFRDVPRGYWAVGYIENAVLNGYMKGSDDDKTLFLPDEAVKLTEAYNSILLLLGYKELIASSGGSLSMIAGLASKAGIALKNQVNELTYGDLARLIYNTFTAYKIERDFSNPTQVNYKYTEPFMEKHYGLHIKENAYVTGNDMTTVTNNPECEAGRGYIDGELYDDPEYLTRKYIGCTGDVFYKEDDGGARTIRLIFTDTGFETEVFSDDISDITSSRFSYWTDGKLKTLKLSSVINIIYNNKLFESTNPADWTAEDGRYILTDTDDDGIIDLIKIYEYEYMVVKTVQTAKERIIGEYSYTSESNGINVLEVGNVFEGRSQNVVYTKNGAPADLSDVTEGSVLSVARSRGSTGTVNIEIDISNSKTGISVEGVSTDSGIKIGDKINADTIWSAGTEYKLTKAFYDSGCSAAVGDMGTAYLTKSGKIFAFAAGNISGLKYGYLKNVFKDQNEDLYYFSVLTSSGSWITFNCGLRLKVNGKSGVTENVLRGGKIAGFSNGVKSYANPQLIRYDNDNDEITEIQTVSVNLTEFTEPAEWDKEMRIAVKNDSFRLSHAGSMRHYGSLKNLDWKVILTKPCPVFLVPDNPQEASRSDFAVRENDFFEYNTPYNVESYDENIYGQPGALVVNISGGAGSVTPSKYILFIKAVEQVINNDNNAVYCVKGFYRGDEVSYNLSEDFNMQLDSTAQLQDLKKGNIIKIALNTNDEIENYEVLYNPELQGKDLRVSTYSGSTNYLYGSIMDTDEGSKLVRMLGSVENDGTDFFRNFWTNNTPLVVIYDAETETFEKSSIGGLEYEDYCVVRIEDTKPLVFFAYRNMF